jgi:hypothetical protein
MFGDRKRIPKPIWITPLVIAAVVLVATIASVLPLTHVTNKPVMQARANFNAPTPIGLPISISLNSPIYVIGPQSLVRGLVGVGVPQSLIKPIGLGQLSSLPGNSTIIIDYSVIEPEVVVGVVNGEMKLNLTSPVIDLLTSLITKGDLVMLYGNSSDLPIMEYLLAYSWARRYGVLYMMSSSVPFDYLIAYPEIPVGSKEALAVAFGGPHYLVIGPAMPRDVLRAVMMYIILKHPSTSQAPVGVNLDPQTQDPCWLAYSNYYESASELEPGVYESNNNYFIWAAPLMNYISGAPYTEGQGVEGYSDGNGTFYYDTCLEIGNQVWASATPPNIPAYVYGFVGYVPTTTMVNNGGQVLMESGDIDYYYSYELYPSHYNSLFGSMLNSYSPSASSQTSNYHIIIAIGPEGPTLEFEYEISLPSGGETISVTQSPTASGIDNIPENNVTWTFNLNNANTNDLYANAFEDASPAYWILPNYSSGTQYEAQLPIRFSAEVMTSSQIVSIEYTPCNYYNNTYEYIWVNASWVLVAQPTQSSTTNLNGAFYGFYQQELGTYVSGVTSWSTLEPMSSGCAGP